MGRPTRRRYRGTAEVRRSDRGKRGLTSPQPGCVQNVLNPHEAEHLRWIIQWASPFRQHARCPRRLMQYYMPDSNRHHRDSCFTMMLMIKRCCFNAQQLWRWESTKPSKFSFARAVRLNRREISVHTKLHASWPFAHAEHEQATERGRRGLVTISLAAHYWQHEACWEMQIHCHRKALCAVSLTIQLLVEALYLFLFMQHITENSHRRLLFLPQRDPSELLKATPTEISTMELTSNTQWFSDNTLQTRIHHAHVGICAYFTFLAALQRRRGRVPAPNPSFVSLIGLSGELGIDWNSDKGLIFPITGSKPLSAHPISSSSIR